MLHLFLSKQAFFLIRAKSMTQNINIALRHWWSLVFFKLVHKCRTRRCINILFFYIFIEWNFLYYWQYLQVCASNFFFFTNENRTFKKFLELFFFPNVTKFYSNPNEISPSTYLIIIIQRQYRNTPIHHLTFHTTHDIIHPFYQEIFQV